VLWRLRLALRRLEQPLYQYQREGVERTWIHRIGSS
jgi:hypothetical protein